MKHPPGSHRPEGMQYRRLWARYRKWAVKGDVVMCSEHRAGERRTRGTRWRWLTTATPGRFARRRASSRCSGRRAAPTPRRHGPGRCPAGAPRTGARPSSWVGARRRRSRIICARLQAGSAGPRVSRSRSRAGRHRSRGATPRAGTRRDPGAEGRPSSGPPARDGTKRVRMSAGSPDMQTTHRRRRAGPGRPYPRAGTRRVLRVRVREPHERRRSRGAP